MATHDRTTLEPERRIAGLDGLRGLAVAAVVVYHLDIGWLPGGFLGVSTFFTLSGFVITRLLLAEHRGHDRIDLGSFYRRRARRLLPPSFATIAVTLGVVIATGAWTRGISADVLAIVGQVANWRQAFSHRSYDALFGAESPFKHFWSLAIEEQFYLAFPVLLIVALRRGGRTPATMIALLMATSFAAGWIGAFEGRYFRTDVRAFELLAGCMLALFEGHLVRVSGWLHGQAIAAILGLALLSAAVSPTHPALHTAVLPVATMLSVLIVADCCCAGSVVGRVLSTAPLVALGRISYSVYLVHWPVNVLVTGTANRLAVTVLATGALHLLVERPSVRVPTMSLVLAGWGLGFGSLAAVVMVGAAPLDAVAVGPEQRSASLDPPLEVRVLGDLDSPAPPPRLSVAVLGDSTGEYLGRALAAHPELSVVNAARRGCPLLDVEAEVQLYPRGPFRRWAEHSGESHDCNWRSYVASVPQSDVTLIVVGPTMLANYRIESGATSVTEPAGQDFLRAALMRLRVELAARPTRLVWVTGPPSEDTGDGARVGWFWNSTDRAEAWNDVIRSVAASGPDAVLEFAAWFEDRPDRGAYRPDGSHLEGVGAELAADWIASGLPNAR